MPDMDGLMLAQEIRTLPLVSALPLILRSSMGRREHLVGEGWFAAYLTKPAKPEKILEVLAGIFRAMPAMPTAIPGLKLPAGSAPSRNEHLLLAKDNTVNQKVAIMMLDWLG